MEWQDNEIACILSSWHSPILLCGAVRWALGCLAFSSVSLCSLSSVSFFSYIMLRYHYRVNQTTFLARATEKAKYMIRVNIYVCLCVCLYM